MCSGPKAIGVAVNATDAAMMAPQRSSISTATPSSRRRCTSSARPARTWRNVHARRRNKCSQPAARPNTPPIAALAGGRRTARSPLLARSCVRASRRCQDRRCVTRTDGRKRRRPPCHHAHDFARKICEPCGDVVLTLVSVITDSRSTAVHRVELKGIGARPYIAPPTTSFINR
jgi:hypothetical protein